MCVTYVTGGKQKPFYTYVTILCKVKGHIWHHKCVNSSYWHVWIYFYILHHWEGEYMFIRLWTRGPQICRTIYKPLPDSTHQKCDMNQANTVHPQFCRVLWTSLLYCTFNSVHVNWYRFFRTRRKKAANNWAPYFTCHNTKFSHLGCHTPGICVPLIWTVTLSWQLAKQPCMKNSQVHKLFNSCQLQYQHNPNTTYTKRHKNSEERFTLLRNTKHKSKLS